MDIPGLFSVYVLPYWPWILAAIAGAMVLRAIIGRAAGLISIVVTIAVFSGVGVSGLLTWISDRGWLDSWPLEGFGIG